MLVTLIGYRATGKSTIGSALARSLDWNWCDSDDEVERRTGGTIAEIFATQGEPAFRDLEAQVIGELAGHPRTVLSVGGGAILREATRELLGREGLVFWLRACPATILDRMRQDELNDARRPRLTALPAAEEISQQLALRTPWYASLADACFDTESLDRDQIIGRMASQVRQRWPLE